MGLNPVSEAGIPAFLAYVVGAALRYVLVAGGTYWIFEIAFRQSWFQHRIQRAFPNSEDVRHEVRWSVVNMIFMGVFTMFLVQLVHDGWSQMYFDIGARGWGYFAASVVGGILGYDTWIYWQHRLLHTPWFFRHSHAIHHRSVNPTALSIYAFHPLESFLGNVYYLLLVLFVPMHPMALNLVVLPFVAYGILGHWGYEFFPRGFTRHPIFGWISTSTHHNMHHSHVGCNYGNWFNYWDRLMGTLHPDYHDYFDAVKERSVAMRSNAAIEATAPASPSLSNRKAA